MKEFLQNKNSIIILLIASMFCWGISWASNKVLASYGNPLNLSLIRFTITTLSLWILLATINQKITFNKKSSLILLGAAISLVIYTLYFLKGLKIGKAGAGGVLVTTLNPIITFILSSIVSKTIPKNYQLLGLILGIISGIFLLNIWNNVQIFQNIGNLYFLFATFVWSILSRFTAQSSKYGSTFVFSFWLYLSCSILVLGISDYKETIRIILQSDAKFWLNMFFSSTITTALATTYYFYATSALGVNKASSFIFLVPTSAALGSWVFLGEVPLFQTIVGGLLGIISVYFINKKEDLKKTIYD